LIFKLNIRFNQKINRGKLRSFEPSVPSPALSGAGSMGMISARTYSGKPDWAPLLVMWRQN